MADLPEKDKKHVHKHVDIHNIFIWEIITSLVTIPTPVPVVLV